MNFFGKVLWFVRSPANSCFWGLKVLRRLQKPIIVQYCCRRLNFIFDNINPSSEARESHTVWFFLYYNFFRFWGDSYLFCNFWLRFHCAKYRLYKNIKYNKLNIKTLYIIFMATTQRKHQNH